MFSVLAELLVSLGICGAFAYFFFLSAPVDDDLGSSGPTSGAASVAGPDGQHHQQQQHRGRRYPDTWWAPLLPWNADGPLYGPYRYALLHVFGLEEDPMALPAAAASFPPTTAAAANSGGGGGGKRGGRGRRGAGALSAPSHHAAQLPPSPLRREGSHWVLVLSRWLGILLLGGGTTTREVWAGRARYCLLKGIGGGNAAWEARVEAREAGLAAAPPRRVRPLVRLLSMELGPGMARDPAPVLVRSTSGTAGASGSPAAATDSSDLTAGQQQQQGDEDGPHALSQSQQAAAHIPVMGIALPRVAGDIASIEVPYFNPRSSGGSTDSSHTPPQSQQPMTLTAAPTPLRCFCIPIVYEDNRFLLRTACCLPLAGLLPAALAIPSDVLSIDCAVTVRRISFHGALYAAFHGGAVELSFPAAPQFTAVVELQRPAARGGRMASSATTTAAYLAGSAMRGRVHQPLQQQGQSPRPTAGSTAAALGMPPLAPAAALAAQQQQQQPPGVSPQLMRSSTAAAAAAAPTPALEQGDKIQALALLAVQRAVASVTYPNVLAGRVRRPSERNGGGGGDLMAWSRGQASLPLYT